LVERVRDSSGLNCPDDNAEAFDRDDFHLSAFADEYPVGYDIDTLSIKNAGPSGAKMSHSFAGAAQEFKFFGVDIPDLAFGNEDLCHGAVGEEFDPQDCSDREKEKDDEKSGIAGAAAKFHVSVSNSGSERQETEGACDEAG
jgi:hypothetical protein